VANCDPKLESEKLIDRKLRSTIKRSGGLYIKLLTLHFIGLPDRLCLLPGGFICFVELKTTGEKLKKIQKYWHKKITKLGFKVYVIDRSAQIKQIIKDYGLRAVK